MYLKSLSGKILYEGRFANIKSGVEMAVEDSVNLDSINLRHANLSGAQLDNAQMPNACFWGANLHNVNLSGANLNNSDFRTANLLNTCLAEANCMGADFSGTYFARTILRQTNLENAKFSCPSVFSIELIEAKSLKGAVYSHLGEIDCDLSHAPLIIRGLHKPLIFMDDCVLVGTDIQKIAMRQKAIQAILAQANLHKLSA